MWERLAVRIIGLVIVALIWIVGIPSAVFWWRDVKRRSR